MNRYILAPDDRIRCFLPETGGSAVIEVFCGRSVIYFDAAQIETAQTVHGTPYAGGKCDALRFVCSDDLLGAKHEVYVPAEHPDYAAFAEGLRRDAPELSLGEEMQFVKETCNHDGKR